MSVPAATTPRATADLPAPLPPASAMRPSVVEPARAAAYRREEDIVFRARGGAASVKLVENGRSNAWFGPKGLTVTSGGSSGSILAAGRATKLAIADGFEVTFSPDATRASIVQARAPLSVVDVATAKTIWSHQHGLGCAARWASPTMLVAHDDGNDGTLWRIDLSTKPAAELKLGKARRADRCWASADGKRWLVRDDFAHKVATSGGNWRYRGVLWRVDGETGAATELLTGPSDVWASASAEEVCHTTDKDALHCMTVGGTDELVAEDAAYAQLDDTGQSIVYSTHGVYFFADRRTKTVRALSGVSGHSGGVVAILSGGDVFVTGSASGVEAFDLRARTKLTIPGASFYGVQAIPGRPRAFVIQRERSDNVTNDLYVAELPP